MPGLEKKKGSKFGMKDHTDSCTPGKVKSSQMCLYLLGILHRRTEREEGGYRDSTAMLV